MEWCFFICNTYVSLGVTCKTVQRPTLDVPTKVTGSRLMRYGFISDWNIVRKSNFFSQCFFQPISKEFNDIKKCLNSRLPLSKLCSKLRTLGYAVSTSNDPGRFVCNYTYYHSLSSCVRENENSIFIHCPPFEVVPEARQLAFVRSFMLVVASELCAQWMANDQDPTEQRSSWRNRGIFWSA